MRVVEQACTSLDLSRRRWVKLSDSGKAALSGWANSMQRLAYAETDQPWGLLADCEGVLEGVGARAHTSLGTHRTQLEESMRGLEAAVDRDARGSRHAAAARRRGGRRRRRRLRRRRARVAGVGPRRADRAHV